LDAVRMLKVLVRQKYHGLSDEETKYQIINRFGFLQWFFAIFSGSMKP
jgi:hypothetical protein